MVSPLLNSNARVLSAMGPYLIQGVVLPERAQISLAFNARFSHRSSGSYAEAKVSIVLNQVAVWISTEHDWDIFDLRNAVKSLVSGYLVTFGYIIGHAYELEIIRVLSDERKIDFVFGIDVPFLSERSKGKDIVDELMKLREKLVGEKGLFLSRCFKDLTSAIKDSDDTGFYCYRAIESLRHHFAIVMDLKDAGKAAQWSALREFSGVNETSIRMVKAAADPLRHGELGGIPAISRDDLLRLTWEIVDAYVAKV